MTAASGILHDEFHSPAFRKQGGTLEMVQLWVNLPAADKMSEPKYQDISDSDIPSVPLSDGAGSVRVIAGTYDGHHGPAETFTPIDVWDVRLKQGHRADFSFTEGRTLAIVVLHGNASVNGDAVHEEPLILFERDNKSVSIDANRDTTILVLIGEPIVGHGPFVMNTEAEIRQAIQDFNAGRFGRIEGVQN